jgi:polyribonucleotide nucleotidyltransferase
MNKVISKPRAELSANAPRIEAVQVPKDKLGEIIGPKGKVIREIEEKTGATLEIDDDGTVRIGATDGESLQKAKDWVLAIAFPPEAVVGKEYEGEVVNITKFGAFVNILPGRDGLLHISKIGGSKRIDNVEDVYSLGDKVQVVVREIDDRGKVSLDVAGAEAPSGDDDDSGPQEGNSEPRDRGERDRTPDRAPRGGRDGASGGDRGNREGGASRDRGTRDRGGDRSGSRGGDRKPVAAPAEKPGRVVVSFEEEFESGK